MLTDFLKQQMHGCRRNYLGTFHVRTECRGIRDITSLLCDTFGSNFDSGMNYTERKKYEERERGRERERECKKRRMRHTKTEIDKKKKHNCKGKERERRKRTKKKKRKEALWHQTAYVTE